MGIEPHFYAVRPALNRAIDSVGDTVEFWFSGHHDLPAAKRFPREVLQRCGQPDRIVIDGSQADQDAPFPAI